MTIPILWWIDDTARVVGTFTISGVDTDPTTITFKIEDPNGNVTVNLYGSSNIVKDSVGIYHLDVLLTVAGNWDFRIVGTGAVQAASEQQLTVQQSFFASP